jgi:F-type H+-transporting ATPase subunit b
MRRGIITCWPLLVTAFLLCLSLCLSGPGQVWATSDETPAATGGESQVGEAPADAGHGDTAAESGHGEAAAEGGHGISSAKIWDLVWRTLNFAVLFILLFVLLRKPASQFFANRRETIAQTLEDFEKKQKAAEARMKELEASLADLTKERATIMAEYVRDGEAEKEKIVAHAHEMAERIKKQAEVTIGNEIKAAKTELTNEVAEMSAAMAEDLIRKSITSQDQERLVEEYLSKVVQN